MTTTIFNRYWWLAFCFGMMITTVAQAAPGNIHPVPLFTATSKGADVPPNIFFQLDDSGSMAYNLLTKKHWQGCLYDPENPINSTSRCQSKVNNNGLFKTYVRERGNWKGKSRTSFTKYTTTALSTSTEWLYDWRSRSVGLNVMYYDPNVTYVPWKNGDGTSMPNASFTAAKNNPTKSRGSTKNLTNFVFEVWHDTHGYDGNFPSVGIETGASGTTVSETSAPDISTSSRRIVGREVRTHEDNTNTTTFTRNYTKTQTTEILVTNRISSSASSQTLNMTTGANGWVDFWDEHTQYVVGASSISKDYISYVPTLAATVTVGTSNETTTTSSETTATGSLPITTTEDTRCTRRRDGICRRSTIIVSNTTTNTQTTTITTDIVDNSAGVRKISLNPIVKSSSSLSTGLKGRTLAAEKTNIANWYQYYRTRMNVAKGSIGAVIDENPDYRYGLNTIQKRTFIEVPAANITDYETHNVNLISELYVLNSKDGTPLPEALERMGKYFDNTLSGKADPIVYECQQNFGILFTDGYWNNNLPTSSSLSGEDIDGDGYKGTVSDVASYYYNTDLSSLNDNVPTNNFDTNKAQHMVTYTVSFGLQGLLDDGDGDGWPDPVLLESDDWGNPTRSSSDIPEKIDDLWHAAFNAKGIYIAAESTEQLAAGFKKILNNVTQRDYEGSASSASFNTSNTQTPISGGNSVYLSQFGLAENIWSGDLLRFELIDNKPSTVVDWKAAQQLALLADPVNDRHIFTYNPTIGTGIPFRWANLSSVAQQDLATGDSGAITAGLTNTETDTVNAQAVARLNFLRGDQSQEGVLRTRSFTDSGDILHKNLLGDVINSSPLLVSSPRAAWPSRAPFPTASGSRYRDFRIAQENRTPMVYLGANDGMLHGFHAITGVEKMAYIPYSLFEAGQPTTGLHYLTSLAYTHRYYVDAPPIVEDVFIDTDPVGISAGEQWHTVLVGSLAAGGRGIFALDITNPSLFDEENTANAAKIALWEFNHTHDLDMGDSFSLPSIVMMNNGRWAAVFGNGYNNQGSGQAALFIAYLDGGVDGAWTEGTDYIKIMASSPDGTDPKTAPADCLSVDCNGLSTPQTVDLNNDRVIDRIYAGDLKGNMWAFDVSDTSDNKWGIAYGTTVKPAPLFTATHHITPSTGNPKVPVQQNLCDSNTSVCRQPITGKPKIRRNIKSFSSNEPNLLVLFGTGQYMTTADTGNTDIQSFYGVWDNGVGSLTPASQQATKTADFIEQNFLAGPFYNDETPPKDITAEVRVLTDNTLEYSDEDTSNHGWFINLSKANGERQFVDSDVIDEKYLFFNTWIPGEKATVSTPNTCSVQGNTSGSGFLMSVDLFSGGSADKALFDLDEDGDLDKAISGNKKYSIAGRAFVLGLPSSSSFVNGTQYTPGTDAGSNLSGTTVIEAEGDQMQRRSWQELRSN